VNSFERFVDEITYTLIDRSRFHTDVRYINYGTLSCEVKRINEINVNNLASLKRRKKKKRKKLKRLSDLKKYFTDKKKNRNK